MALFIFIVIGLMFINIKFLSKEETYFNDYMSIEKTTAIKGLFILLICITHSEQYVDVGTGLLAAIYNFIRLALGQSVVTCFLFYSGYGIYQSLLKKKQAYLDSFLKKRVLKTLVHFDIAVLIYALISFITKQVYPLHYYPLALIGWIGVGNSAWFIFDILCAYLIVYFSFNKNSDLKNGLVKTTILSIIFIILMVIFKESRYYNTFITFVMGMWYAHYQKEFESFVLKSNTRYWLIFAGLVLIYGVSGYLLIDVYETYEFLYIPLPAIFILAFVIFTMKVSINNKILRFFGKISFSLFILMRIPMNLLQLYGYTNNQYIFTIICFGVSVILAYLFDKCLAILDKKIFS